ncbi:MAG: sugar-transfer associated ATP-grasp domain-containing protein [Clostridia bacterium]|nr:sugar-transfer associated ATP-grasp domain-containing protein [Clostridia bacterium]
MGNINYLFKRIKSMNFSNMVDTAKQVHQETGKNTARILFDIVYCGYKYMAGFVDYKVFKMYLLNKEQRATYITRGVNNNYVKLLNDPEAMKKVDNKLEFNKIYSEFIKRDWISLTEVSYEEFEMFFKKHKDIIVKPVDEMCGKGVAKITLKEDTDIKVVYDELIKNNQILIEECVKQNNEIAKLNPSSVNTLRVVTLKKENEVKVLFTALRIGNGKSVDNFNNGGMFTVVNEDGTITKPAISKDGTVYTEHPLTHEKIVGFKLPNFDIALDTAKKCASQIEKVRYIGFDVVITEDDALILEANPFPGHDLYQSVAHLDEDLQGLKPRFDKEIFGNKKEEVK